MTINILDLGLIIALQALLGSMIADLVEQSEIKTGRRSEGVFYAAVTFARKSTQGFGVLAAGFVLAFASFPENPRPGEIPGDALWRLAVAYVPLIVCLYTGLLIAIWFYRIDRDSHNRNLKILSERKALK